MLDRIFNGIICNSFDFLWWKATERRRTAKGKKNPISSNRAEDDPSYYPPF